MIAAPEDRTLIKLASLAVHVQEHEETGQPEDLVAAQTLARDPEVTGWLSALDPVFLPVRRSLLDQDERGPDQGSRIKVTPEGRPDCWLPDRASLVQWLREQGTDPIHSMAGAGGIALGADHSREGVIESIPEAITVALTTGDAWRGNMRHALAIVSPPMPGRLLVFDVGELDPDRDLEVVTDEAEAERIKAQQVEA